jgi:hypothetical protein
MTDKKIQEDYVVTMSSRLMNMQAHLIHAGHSKKKVVWYDELTKTNETDELTKTNETDEPTKIDQDTPIEDGLQQKIFKTHKNETIQTNKQTNKQTKNKIKTIRKKEDKGFNKELLQCWRKLKGCKLELADCVEIGKADHDPVTAVFKDGARLIITDCTTSQYKKLTGAPGERKITTHHIDAWAGEHSISKNKLCVRARTDRELLMSMYEQKLQILQVKVSTFQVAGADEKMAIENAGKFMAHLAEDYASDKLRKENLKAARDERLVALGLDKKTRGVKKKEAIRESVLFYEIPAAVK